MNMTPIAQAVQSQGRGNDTMLVHMTPREVGGLQALAMAHGGSLSINPKTGLPEAGFLDNLLPAIIGGGLMLVPGMQGVGAGYIGAGVGAIEAMRTGDIGKGLMAGLGAYGGANLAGSLSTAGAQQAQQAAMAKVSAEQAANEAALANLGSDTGFMGTFPGTEAGNQQLVNAYTQAAPKTFAGNLAATGEGLTGLSTQTGREAFMGQVGGLPGLAKTTAATAAPFIVDSMTPPPIKTPASEKSNYEGPYTPSERAVRYPDEEERQRLGTSEYTYFTPSNPVPYAKGGSVPQLEDGGFVLTKKAVDGLGKGSNKKGQENARRGLGAIPIKGPGTGTSDSIKTTIDGKRPALISNGEAYVPKRQVAKRGGAKAFYALMNKAEKAADRRKRT